MGRKWWLVHTLPCLPGAPAQQECSLADAKDVILSISFRLYMQESKPHRVPFPAVRWLGSRRWKIDEHWVSNRCGDFLELLQSIIFVEKRGRADSSRSVSKNLGWWAVDYWVNEIVLAGWLCCCSRNLPARWSQSILPVCNDIVGAIAAIPAGYNAIITQDYLHPHGWYPETELARCCANAKTPGSVSLIQAAINPALTMTGKWDTQLTARSWSSGDNDIQWLPAIGQFFHSLHCLSRCRCYWCKHIRLQRK